MESRDAVKPDPLEGLASEADNLAATAAAPPLGEGVTDADVAAREQQQEATNTELVAGMIKLARDTVTEMADVQSIQKTIGDDVANKLGAMWGEVLDGYGIRLNDQMGKHGKAIMAGLFTLAVAKSVYKGYQAELAQRKPPAAPAPEQPAAAAA